MKILLVEDNLELAQSLAELLRQHAFVVDHVDCGDAADQLLSQSHYDLLLLDLNLPQLSGKALLRRLRERGDSLPVIVLTASDSLDQKVLCLEIGADDYLVKPVEVRELLARMQAIARRQMPGRENLVRCGNLQLDLRTRLFSVAGEELALPPRERSVLEALMLQNGSALPKQRLMDVIYGMDEEASADAVDLYVHRLRKKLQASDTTIMTLRGVGYLLKQKLAGGD
ncbi:response regulator transcription factor [Comamonas piscis]|uniref:Response regulator transcription factor n=1 Tax=Comamonas piscis TaxID=1562974 RepID=A0A7G5EKA7_9BURK|nr:response regulator transcription factor [Comamonas piscis]QMV74432.1 response regulator transcription factor [Comamonas piscis]WSO32887.1 response regulator transcription factor [Comamonas piscis]